MHGKAHHHPLRHCVGRMNREGSNLSCERRDDTATPKMFCCTCLAIHHTVRQVHVSYVCAHILVRTYLPTYLPTCLHTYTPTTYLNHTHTRTYTCIHIDTLIHMPTCTCTYIHTNAQTYTHTHRHTYVQTHLLTYYDILTEYTY